MAFGPTVAGTVQDRTTWPVLLFLLAGVIVPAAGVLWFMNEAAKGQAEAARQQVNDAYRGQLRFIRDRVDAVWEARAAPGLRSAEASPAIKFKESVGASLADSFVFVNGDGSAAYPSRAISWVGDEALDPPELRRAEQLEASRDLSGAIAQYGAVARDARRDRQGVAFISIAGRAAQAQIRCLVQSGQKEAALRAIEQYFSTGRLIKAEDAHRRLIAADEYLLAVQLMKPADRAYQTAVSRLADRLNDYKGWPMPSAQRLFLMTEVRAMRPTPNRAFPTYEAEQLAAEFLEKDDLREHAPRLEASGVPEVWKLRSGNIIGLYRTSAVLNTMRAIADQAASPQVRFELIPP